MASGRENVPPFPKPKPESQDDRGQVGENTSSSILSTRAGSQNTSSATPTEVTMTTEATITTEAPSPITATPQNAQRDTPYLEDNPSSVIPPHFADGYHVISLELDHELGNRYDEKEFWFKLRLSEEGPKMQGQSWTELGYVDGQEADGTVPVVLFIGMEKVDIDAGRWRQYEDVLRDWLSKEFPNDNIRYRFVLTTYYQSRSFTRMEGHFAIPTERKTFEHEVVASMGAPIRVEGFPDEEDEVGSGSTGAFAWIIKGENHEKELVTITCDHLVPTDSVLIKRDMNEQELRFHVPPVKDNENSISHCAQRLEKIDSALSSTDMSMAKIAERFGEDATDAELLAIDGNDADGNKKAWQPGKKMRDDRELFNNQTEKRSIWKAYEEKITGFSTYYGDLLDRSGKRLVEVEVSGRKCAVVMDYALVKVDSSRGGQNQLPEDWTTWRPEIDPEAFESLKSDLNIVSIKETPIWGQDKVGQLVMKHGRRTATTTGMVRKVVFEPPTEDEENFTTAKLVMKHTIKPTPDLGVFSSAGDSGAAINTPEAESLGILYSGFAFNSRSPEQTRTHFTPWTYIKKDLWDRRGWALEWCSPIASSDNSKENIRLVAPAVLTSNTDPTPVPPAVLTSITNLTPIAPATVTSNPNPALVVPPSSTNTTQGTLNEVMEAFRLDNESSEDDDSDDVPWPNKDIFRKYKDF